MYICIINNQSSCQSSLHTVAHTVEHGSEALKHGSVVNLQAIGGDRHPPYLEPFYVLQRRQLGAALAPSAYYSR